MFLHMFIFCDSCDYTHSCEISIHVMWFKFLHNIHVTWFSLLHIFTICDSYHYISLFENSGEIDTSKLKSSKKRFFHKV